MIVLVCLIVLLRELLVSTIFCMVHPYIPIHSQLNYLLHIFFVENEMNCNLPTLLSRRY